MPNRKIGSSVTAFNPYRPERPLAVGTGELIQPATGLGKRFGDLKVRPKLIVLHNLFFFVLACAVYLTLVPLIEKRIFQARTIEVSLVTEIFAADRSPARLPRIDSYDYREGTPDQLGVPSPAQTWLEQNPGAVWQNAPVCDYLFRKDARTGLYRRITLPNTVYDDVVQRAKLALFLVLGVIYVLAVLLLELIIMPLYVYQPLGLMLQADAATQQGDRERELIDEAWIPGDEIGQIMRSRNQTVSELRKQEDHLARALAQLEAVAADLKSKHAMLEAQDRLASLGLLSASVAHELNTPLAVLHGSVEKLIETVPEPAAQDRLCRMLRVTKRLQKISEGLVDFALVRRQEMGAVPLHPLIEEAWSLVAIDEKASKVHFSNQTSLRTTALGNSERLVQVFVNLLRNSLHAIDTNGHISVSSEEVNNGRKAVCIRVDDDGPGIPAEVLPDIFDAFVSSRLDARGTGLGLAVAEGIVQQHGGTIAARNRPEGGARLEVTLQSWEASEKTSE